MGITARRHHYEQRSELVAPVADFVRLAAQDAATVMRVQRDFRVPALHHQLSGNHDVDLFQGRAIGARATARGEVRQAYPESSASTLLEVPQPDRIYPAVIRRDVTLRLFESLDQHIRALRAHAVESPRIAMNQHCQVYLLRARPVFAKARIHGIALRYTRSVMKYSMAALERDKERKWLVAPGVAASGIAQQFAPGPDQFGTFFSASTLGCSAGPCWADGLRTAWDIASLVWARVITGLGLGGALPNLIALVSESSGKKPRAHVALVYAGAPLGGAVASLISLPLEPSQWRWIFIAGGVVPLVLVPIMSFMLQDSVAFRSSRAGSATHGGAEEASRAEHGGFMAILAAGRACLTLQLWASFFLGLLILYLLLNWLPILLVGVGLTRTGAVGAQIGFNTGGAIAALLMGCLLESRWRVPTVLVTFLSLPVLIVMLARCPANEMLIVLVVCLLGCAVLASQAFLYAVAPTSYPTAIRGMGVGAAVAVGRLGSIVGPKLGGVLKAAGHGSAQLLMDLLPLVVLGSLSALLLARYTLGQSGKGVVGAQI